MAPDSASLRSPVLNRRCLAGRKLGAIIGAAQLRTADALELVGNAELVEQDSNLEAVGGLVEIEKGEHVFPSRRGEHKTLPTRLGIRGRPHQQRFSEIEK